MDNEHLAYTFKDIKEKGLCYMMRNVIILHCNNIKLQFYIIIFKYVTCYKRHILNRIEKYSHVYQGRILGGGIAPLDPYLRYRFYV